MLVSIEQVNRTENYNCGEEELFEPFTDKINNLFRAFQREHGRCTGKVYIDLAGDESRPIGWVFEKVSHYEDTGTPFLLETWVTLHKEKPKIIKEYFYHFLDERKK